MDDDLLSAILRRFLQDPVAGFAYVNREGELVMDGRVRLEPRELEAIRRAVPAPN